MAEPEQTQPRHVAIIMDGNGRWAAARGLPRTRGHREGIKSVERVVDACLELGIPYLSLYAFSTENWSRPAREVAYLMRQLERYLKTERASMVKKGVHLRPIGRLEALSPAVQRELRASVEATRDCHKLFLCLALNYGGRAEIVDAVRAIAREAIAGSLKPEEIDERIIADRLYTRGVPDPDLLIRTSGEERISNFLLWQVSYTELYSTPVLWPDFGADDLRQALDAFGRRDRRFGGVPGAGRGARS